MYISAIKYYFIIQIQILCDNQNIQVHKAQEEPQKIGNKFEIPEIVIIQLLNLINNLIKYIKQEQGKYQTAITRMDNFHYRNLVNNVKTEKGNKLVQQLQIIDRQLEQDYRKAAERKKLEEEFYQDANLMKNNNANKISSNRMNLADQIMNELLNPKVQIKNNNISPNVNQPRSLNYNLSPGKLVRQQINYNANANLLPLNPANPYIPVPISIQPENAKRNQIVNIRQLQKQKLQNRYAQQQFPFGNNSRQKERKFRMSPQREGPIKDNYIPPAPTSVNVKNKPKQNANIQNPFLKDEPLIKQKREQQQKQYRLLLQQQMQEQKRRKEQQKQRIKQQQKMKYNNLPVPNINFNPINAQSPTNEQNLNPNKISENINRKRRDPNAQHTPIEKPSGEIIRPSDIEFMKAQVMDFRNKFKKGRINHQQYQTQIRKLQNHYKMKADQFLQQQNQKQKDKNLQKPQINESQKITNHVNTSFKAPTDRVVNASNMGDRQQYQYLINKNKSNNQLNLPNQVPQYYANTSAPIETINSNVRYNPQFNPSYPQMGPTNVSAASIPPQNDYQMQMMFKLLDQFKNIFKMQTQSHFHDKKVLQQTLTKMIPSMNPNMYTQQLPPYQIASHPPRQYHTDTKKVQRLDQFPQPSESQISSSYIQKSMSGIVNKIPLTKKQKQQEKQDPSKDIVKFYEKKYKVKKFKGFQYTQSDNKSNIVIPSVSNFLQTKNSQNQLTEAFQRDLKNYKKLEKDRNIQLMVEKIKKTKQSSQQKNFNKQQFQNQTSNFYKQQAPKKTQSLHTQQPNPFLKKHISNQSSQSQPQKQNTSQPNKSSKYNTYQNINSPTPKSAQILQQQQYQTQSRRIQSPTNVLARISEVKNDQFLKKKPHEHNLMKNGENLEKKMGNNNNKQYPSSKILNIMKTNNQILAKYEMTPSQNPNQRSQINSNSISSIKQSNRIDSSKDISNQQYFSGQQISPVQRREYESSMQTVRSQEQSARLSRKNNMQLLMMGSNNHSEYQSNYRSPIPSAQNPYGSPPTIQSMQISKKNQVSRNNPLYQYQNNGPNITGYSQTLQSIQQSSSKLPSFHRPPNNNSKRSGKSAGRKKQSVVKISGGQNFQKSALSGIPSEGSREKSQSLKPSYQQNIQNMSSAKFDSAVYESAYQQSVDPRQRVHKELKFPVVHIHQNQSSSQSIPKTFKQVLQKGPSKQNIEQVRPPPSINIIYTKQQLKKQGSQLSQSDKYTNAIGNAIPKWRSLEQARKIAKQCKLKSGEDHNRSSVQEKLSQLQSFMLHGNSHINANQNVSGVGSSPQTVQKSGQHRLKQVNRQQSTSRREQNTENKKKDISKLLDELGEQQYDADFQSYKQQSQR